MILKFNWINLIQIKTQWERLVEIQGYENWSKMFLVPANVKLKVKRWLQYDSLFLQVHQCIISSDQTHYKVAKRECYLFNNNHD